MEPEAQYPISDKPQHSDGEAIQAIVGVGATPFWRDLISCLACQRMKTASVITKPITLKNTEEAAMASATRY